MESLKGSWNFVKKYPQIFLFQAVISLLILWSSVISENLSYNQKMIFFIFPLVLFLLEATAYPVFVFFVMKKRKKVNFTRCVSISIKILPFTSLYFLLVLFIIMFPSLIGFIFIIGTMENLLTFSLEEILSTFLPFLLIQLVCLFISLYLFLRFWFALPVYILEKKGVFDAISTTWKKSKGKAFSIFLTLLIFFLFITLPLSLIGGLLILSSPSLFTYWKIFTDVFIQPLANSLPTVYYLKMKGKRR